MPHTLVLYCACCARCNAGKQTVVSALLRLFGELQEVEGQFSVTQSQRYEWIVRLGWV